MGHTAGRNLFFRAGASVFLLFNAEATRQGNALPPHGATGPGHTCFQVDTAAYDPWKRHLEEHGVEILQKVEWGAGPNTPFRPGRSFYFSDPSGNLLEIANADFWPE
jgi:catechol 2,3-dioxygenase-like lactoylglutathione lyase family enzyme